MKITVRFQIHYQQKMKKKRIQNVQTEFPDQNCFSAKKKTSKIVLTNSTLKN